MPRPRFLAPKKPQLAAGSNTWTIGPSHSASGNSMLLINPHLAWGDTFYRYMEVHLVGPDYDLYGAPQIGFPVPVVGFNRARRMGPHRQHDRHRRFLPPDKRTASTYSTASCATSSTKPKTLKIKQPDGSLKEERSKSAAASTARWSTTRTASTIAMRVAGLDRPKMLEQWFRMGEATTSNEFKDALRMMSVPMWNANYADDQGHIMLVFDGLVPKRNGQRLRTTGPASCRATRRRRCGPTI